MLMCKFIILTALSILPLSFAVNINEGINTVRDKLNIDVTDPRDIPQINEFRKRCIKLKGKTTWRKIERGWDSLISCVQREIKLDVVTAEIEKGMDTGDLDTVFMKYCGKQDQFMACVEDYLDLVEVCMKEDQLRGLNITRDVINAGIDFTCYAGGTRIAIFMAEEGRECVQEHQEEIKECVNAQNSNISLFDLESLAITDETCRLLTEVQSCIVTATEKCDDPTPANVLESLTNSMLKQTPCWQTKSALLINNSALSLLQLSHIIPHVLTLVIAAITAATLLL